MLLFLGLGRWLVCMLICIDGSISMGMLSVVLCVVCIVMKLFLFMLFFMCMFVWCCLVMVVMNCMLCLFGW